MDRYTHNLQSCKKMLRICIQHNYIKVFKLAARIVKLIKRILTSEKS